MRITSLLALILPLLLLAPAASADGPQTTRFDFTETFVDAELCGFEVTFDVHVRGTDTVYPSGSDSGWDEIIHATKQGTLTNASTGRTLLQSGGASLFIDADQGTFTFRGLPQKFTVPSGGVLVRDAGSATFDFDDNVLVLRGPHPLITDSDAASAEICGYLSAT
jgi:hypothetical protein